MPVKTFARQPRNIVHQEKMDKKETKVFLELWELMGKKVDLVDLEPRVQWDIKDPLDHQVQEVPRVNLESLACQVWMAGMACLVSLD